MYQVNASQARPITHTRTSQTPVMGEIPAAAAREKPIGSIITWEVRGAMSMVNRILAAMARPGTGSFSLMRERAEMKTPMSAPSQ